MKKLIFAIPILALAACGSAFSGTSGSMSDGTPITTNAADPGEFTGLALAGPDNVIFTTSSDFSIRAEGDEEVIERLRYELDDGQLKIGRKRENMGWTGGYDSATIYVTAPALSSAKIAGSGDIKADAVGGDTANLGVTGSGNLNVTKVDARAVTAKISGSGDMKLSGTAKILDASVTGSGTLGNKDFKVDEANLKVTGSGDIAISSDGTVDAKITGSGDILIEGDAKCTSKTTGSGEVTCG